MTFNKTLVSGIKVILGLGVIGFLLVILWREKELVAKAMSLSAKEFAQISIFTLLTWIVTTVSHLSMMRVLGYDIRFGDLFAVHIGSGLLNHLPFKPGTAYRAVKLKQHASFKFAHFGSFMMVNAAVLTLTAGLVGLGISLFGIDFGQGIEGQITIGGMICMTLAGALPLLISLPRIKSESRLAKVWNNMKEGRDLLVGHVKVLVFICCCHTLAFIFAAGRFAGAFSAIDMTLPIWSLLFMGCSTVLIQLVSLTPGGLGVRELVVGASGALVGIPVATGVVIVTVIRAVITLWYFVLGIPSLILLRQK